MRCHPVPVLVLAGALTVGCSPGAQPDSPNDGPPSVATPGTATRAPSSTTTAARIPDGTWAREITTEEIERRDLELPPGFVVDNYLADGSVKVVLRTQGSRWSILVQDDAGAFEVGDSGGSTYDTEGRWVHTDDVSGTTRVLEWELEDDSLTTSALTRPEGQSPPEDDERLVLEGTWQLDD
ncbi:hypothetical protein [Ornithinimicrobium sp. LYQ103]|uniref:hypothetical protein n=1 Tax=Ornithinimicrobium sp. LYQ103 TaxID=3378796 RepID=UPI0038554308